jgi:uncharacterized protein (DUF1015 family)
VPILRPFRALRYGPALLDGLARLITPPYDVIPEELQAELAARDPHNAIHLELPPSKPGEDPDERYRRAARTLAEWRSDGTLRKDPRPALYVYEQRFRAEDGTTHRQRGFMARLRLEPLGADSGVLRHERTMSAPKEDRYRLLRATGTNTSPVILLYESGETGALLDALVVREPDEAAVDEAGTEHRVWLVEVDDPELGDGARALLERAARGPLTIADGHHRYETALRYAAERGRACETDPPFDYVLVLLYDIGSEALTVLPTHRLVRGIPSGKELRTALAPLAEVEPLSGRAELLALMARGPDPAGEAAPRIGLWTDGQAAIIRPGPELAAALNGASPALRGLDVSLLGALLEDRFGIGTAEAAAGDRIGYTKDAAEALRRVDAGDASAAFLLDPTPVSAVAAVARAGEVMPQKSTYFHPKAATGLLFNPLES